MKHNYHLRWEHADASKGRANDLYKLFKITGLTAILISLLFSPLDSSAQQILTLKDAIKLTTNNYGTIKAKQKYALASQAGVKQARLDYLPNINLSAQNDYGTVNGQNGPLYAFGAPGLATSGPALGSQNWNAAFGALYLTNVNWDFFAFGRSREKIKTATAVADRDIKDTQQEIFEQEVRVSAAYLNLLAAQRLRESYRKNLARADTLRNIIVVKAKHDLVAGVDSSQANSEVSSAKSTLIKATTTEDEQRANLIKFLSIAPQRVEVDTFFISRLPKDLSSVNDTLTASHPAIQYQLSRISLNEAQTRYFKTFSYPTFTLGGVFQSRGSGFSSNYGSDQNAYTENYGQGIKPQRTNYLFALGITWNLTQPFRVKQQVKSQRLIGEGLRDELELTRQQLKTDVDLSDAKIKNAIADYYETPFQVKAATDAYNQKKALYNHGLTSLVDVTQALYALVRAETDRDIAYNNVWQALLLKAAAAGDFAIFYKNL